LKAKTKLQGSFIARTGIIRYASVAASLAHGIETASTLFSLTVFNYFLKPVASPARGLAHEKPGNHFQCFEPFVSARTTKTDIVMTCAGIA
jgi:hypothetical protein